MLPSQWLYQSDRFQLDITQDEEGKLDLLDGFQLDITQENYTTRKQENTQKVTLYQRPSERRGRWKNELKRAGTKVNFFVIFHFDAFWPF